MIQPSLSGFPYLGKLGQCKTLKKGTTSKLKLTSMTIASAGERNDTQGIKNEILTFISNL
jgi:hypothetical protein